MKTYTLNVSNKQSVIIDEDDFNKFLSQGSESKFIKLKKIIINPSFVISITRNKDEEPTKKVEGYLDKEKNVFVVTNEKSTDKLEDDFISHAVKAFER